MRVFSRSTGAAVVRGSRVRLGDPARLLLLAQVRHLRPRAGPRRPSRYTYSRPGQMSRDACQGRDRASGVYQSNKTDRRRFASGAAVATIGAPSITWARRDAAPASYRGAGPDDLGPFAIVSADLATHARIACRTRFVHPRTHPTAIGYRPGGHADPEHGASATSIRRSSAEQNSRNVRRRIRVRPLVTQRRQRPGMLRTRPAPAPPPPAAIAPRGP